MTKSSRSGHPRLSLFKKLTFASVTVFGALLLLEGAARGWIALSPRTIEVETVDPDGGTDWLGILSNDVVGVDGAVDLYVPDADLYWRLRPGVRAEIENIVYQTRDEAVRWELQTNRDGHRGEVYPPGNAAPVIVALGDSCTFGWGVNEDQTYPAQLQGYLRSHGLPDASVINYAVPGYSSFQGRRQLEDILERHEPDFLLLAFGANDHEKDRYSDSEKARRGSAFRRRLGHVLGNLAIYRVLRPVPELERALPEDPSELPDRVSAEEFRNNMRAMVDAAERAGTKVILLDLVLVEPVLGEQIVELARERRLPQVEARTVLSEALVELLGGRRFQAERAELDRFWAEDVAGYRQLYYPEVFYHNLFDDPVWSGLLRYFLFEPVHPNALGHLVIAEVVGRRILEAQDGSR